MLHTHDCATVLWCCELKTGLSPYMLYSDYFPYILHLLSMHGDVSKWLTAVLVSPHIDAICSVFKSPILRYCYHHTIVAAAAAPVAAGLFKSTDRVQEQRAELFPMTRGE